MGLRFRKRVKIAPGISLNFSKSGISANVGPRGANLSIGKKGTYLNSGIPGTGLSARTRLTGPKQRAVQLVPEPPKERSGISASQVIVALLIVGVIVLLSR
ncbi:DUF4236 domain-containing protein [Paracoccus fontiphilus]|uniref:DUF4236 domain-containing protein n=1 Tax=Paracoccus fontiphilus TaxID=1815556 RepID=A0ABV7IFE5_9RHOB|nr:DUF4236 domain-containing protein [Paracoccus fontiphilus]